MAHVCSWALGLALFHRLLRPLLCSLSAKKSDDAGGDDSNVGMLMDADVAYHINRATFCFVSTAMCMDSFCM